MRLLVNEYTDCTRGERSPILFHNSEDGETLLLLADASETAFSNRYQPLIDVMKASFMESMRRRSNSLPERLRIASRAIEKIMRECFPSSNEFGEQSYSAVFVALGFDGSNAYPLWIGSPQAQLLRGGVCVRTTTPQVTVIPSSNQIFTESSISTNSDMESNVVDGEPWPLMIDDMVVLADCRLFALFSRSELANLVGGTKGNKAKALVEAAQTLKYAFAQSAIVAQVL